MSGIVWLASYPKSGNTWMRALLANLFTAGGEGVDINRLSRRGGIASSREVLDHLTLLDTGLLTAEEIELLRPAALRAWGSALSSDGATLPPSHHPLALRRFVKCHDAYTRLPDGTPLLGGADAASGAIVIVRDPRDVAPSLADYRGWSIDQAITFMNDPQAAQGASGVRQRPQVPERLLDWSGHVSSWLGQRDIPVHLMRYEAMWADTAAALGGAMRFAGEALSGDRIARAVAHSAFESLRRQEEAHGFAEAAAGRRFFRSASSGAWRETLTLEQVRRIEHAHGSVMRKLGYQPTLDSS